MRDIRRYRRNFTSEAAQVAKAMMFARVGTCLLAAAVGRRKAWLAQKLHGHRRLTKSEAEMLMAAIRKIEYEQGNRGENREIEADSALLKENEI
jgi:hypothetical protein